jgi:predicted AlkP superfamily pyrophosphatase or phosphodiesterase
MSFRTATAFLISPLAVISLALTLCAQPRVRQAGKEKPQPLVSRVILISISGLRSDDFTSSQTSRLRLPTLREFQARGAHALNVESVYPSQTLPAHATMVTGMLPSDHGVTADRAFDEQSGKAAQEFRQASAIKTDTLWGAARRAGIKTAAIGFPLTEGAEIDFNSPAEIQAINAQAIKLADLKSQDQQRKEAAVETIRQQRPHLVLLHFDSYARAGRYFGLASSEAAEALEGIDALLKQVVDAAASAGVAHETAFLIVSDHGLMKVEREFRPNVVLGRKEFLKTDGQGRIVSWRAAAQVCGGSAAIFLHNQQDEQTAREVEAAFREVHEQVSSPVWRVVTRRDASRLGADPRAAFYLDAAPGYAMTDAIGGGLTGKAGAATGRAAGGYLPQRLEMRAVLIAFGPGVRPKTQIEYARLIDIAPTVARLLGIELRATRGRVLSEIISQPSPSPVGQP